MSTHALIIHPGDPDYVPSADFEDYLRECGFIGQPYTRWYGESGFNPGDNFLKFIEFKFSHPIIKLVPTPEGIVEADPEDSRRSCTIQIESSNDVSIIAGDGSEFPRCPGCAYSIAAEEYGSVLEPWLKFRETWLCPACGNRYFAADLDYQQTVAFSRYWLDVQSIYHGEAKPSGDFLRLLARETSQNWRYMWLHR
jgi:hypothetical protein